VKRPLFIKNLYCMQRTLNYNVFSVYRQTVIIFFIILSMTFNFILLVKHFIFLYFEMDRYITQSLPKTKKVRLQTDENVDALYKCLNKNYFIYL
jgi:predicted membrane protein